MSMFETVLVSDADLQCPRSMLDAVSMGLGLATSFLATSAR
jgi:hypothetical protein